MQVIDRYLIRQIAVTWVMVTCVLLLITLGYAFADTVGDVAAGRLNADLLFIQLGLSTLESLTVLGPLSLYMGILLTIARLYRDLEMVALSACGYGLKQVYRPVLLLVIPVFVLLLVISLWVSPWADRTAKELAEKAVSSASISQLQPGQFHEFAANNSVIYVGSSTADGQFQDAFIHIERDQRKDVITARTGFEYEVDGARYLVLEDGARSEGVPGQADFRTMRFERNDLRLPDPALKEHTYKYSSWRVADLLAEDNVESSAELQWRVSMALAVVALSILAVPLARTRPREGFYSNLLIGILLYMVYANLMAVVRNWIDEGQLPPVPGMWWVHLLPLCVAAWMFRSPKRAGKRRVKGARS